jgi:hypothetical protein
MVVNKPIVSRNLCHSISDLLYTEQAVSPRQCLRADRLTALTMHT